MRLSTITAALAACISTARGVEVPSYTHCPPLGPVLPAPSSLSKSKAVQTAVAGIKAYFQNNTATLKDTAVSLSAVSLHEDTPLLDLHWTPPSRSPESKNKIDRDTVYRVGSMSKAYTALAVLTLADKIQLTDPVTKYVPELRDLYKGQNDKSAVTAVDWDEVTVEALMSHLADIGTQSMTPYLNLFLCSED